jgi:hypothetical protein
LPLLITHHFFQVTLVTFVTKVTNLPIVTFAIVTKVTSVHWLLWLRERVTSFVFFPAYILYLAPSSVKRIILYLLTAESQPARTLAIRNQATGFGFRKPSSGLQQKTMKI